MTGDHHQVLLQVVRIAGRTAHDPFRAIKDILRLLAGSLHLEDASLHLLDPSQQTFSRLIHASGAEVFLPCARKVAGTPQATVLQGGAAVAEPGLRHLPVRGPRDFGVLSLKASPGHPLLTETEGFLSAVCDTLSGLAQVVHLAASERRLALKQSLLAGLGREFAEARTLQEFLASAVESIGRHCRAACVILRPLHGETVLGRCQVSLAVGYQGLRALFVDLEEKEAAQALAKGKPVLRRDLAAGAGLASALPPVMATVPLLCQGRLLGTLTLFGGEDDASLFLDAEATEFFATLAALVAHALDRVTALERLDLLAAESERTLLETTLLYRIARAMHSTLRLNELMHLILSAATAAGGGGFERAMLFMLNERSGILQGMLCVTRDTSPLVLPPHAGTLAWERPSVEPEILEKQRQSLCCRLVMQQRLNLNGEENALARAVRKGRVVLVPDPAAETPSGRTLAEDLGLAPYACAPLLGRNRVLAVLVVDNPDSREEIATERLRFLELFANLAGGAMENSMLLHRLETAHNDLRETQERLLQGEKMAVLGEMAASVAHELRSPLVAIGGFAHRLSRHAPADSEAGQYAAVIVREVRRMEQMLTDILGFAKKEMLCFSDCRLDRVVEEVLALEAEALERAAVRLVTEIDPELPAVQGDEQKLRQVIINLITNARQVMSSGGSLTIRARPASLRGEAAAEVEVEDTGGGIPPEVLRNIFNPFFTTKEKGTGLGLSISHRIVEQHQGEIEVRNRELGAVFILRLPARLHPAPFH